MKSYIFLWTDEGIENIYLLSDLEKMWQEETILGKLMGYVTYEVGPYIIDKLVTSICKDGSLGRKFYVYLLDCDDTMSTEWWYLQWAKRPEACAYLCIIDGIKIYDWTTIKEET